MQFHSIPLKVTHFGSKWSTWPPRPLLLLLAAALVACDTTAPPTAEGVAGATFEGTSLALRDAATGEAGSQAAAAVLDNEIVAQTTAAQEDQIVYLDPMAWYIVFGGLDSTRIMIDDVLQIAE